MAIKYTTLEIPKLRTEDYKLGGNNVVPYMRRWSGKADLGWKALKPIVYSKYLMIVVFHFELAWECACS